jgi:hypothetical protein
MNAALSYNTSPAAAPAPTADAAASPADAAPATMVETSPAPQPSYSVTQTVTTVTPIAHPGGAVGYCQTMAQSTGADATRDGMDGPAQQAAADATYRQCLALYGASGR